MFCRLAPILGRDCRQQSPQKDGAPVHPPVTMAAGAFEECSAGAIIHGTLPCSKNVLVFSSKNLRSILWWNIYLQSMCARFSHPEKLVPKTPRQANSQTKAIICTCSANLRVFFGGWGKENLKPMDLDGVGVLFSWHSASCCETCGICALSDGHAVAAKTWCAHVVPWKMTAARMTFPGGPSSKQVQTVKVQFMVQDEAPQI